MNVKITAKDIMSEISGSKVEKYYLDVCNDVLSDIKMAIHNLKAVAGSEFAGLRAFTGRDEINKLLNKLKSCEEDIEAIRDDQGVDD